jgi:hypothetical protein
MSRVHDKGVDDAEQPVPEPVGKVEFDSRGNSVWRWARDVLESTSVLLKRLENKDLALEPTQKVPVMRGADRAPKGSASERKGATPRESKSGVQHPAAPRERHDGGGGFDPYNSR